MRSGQAEAGTSAETATRRSQALDDAPDLVERGEGDAREHDFPPGLSKPALRALLAAGYTRLDQLASVGETELLKLHGMGPKAIAVIRAALDTRRHSWSEADTS